MRGAGGSDSVAASLVRKYHLGHVVLTDAWVFPIQLFCFLKDPHVHLPLGRRSRPEDLLVQ